MVAYATSSDVYGIGVPPGALSFPARLVEAADATGNTLELNGHALATDTAIQFTADDDGLLPAPLALATVYYARPVAGSDSLLQVAATAGGAAINLTTAGTAPFRLVRSVAASIASECDSHSRWVDSLLTGHVVPLTAPYPAWVVAVVAKRAARSLIRMLGLGGLQHVIDEADSVERDVLRMARSGLSLRDSAATASANLTTGASPTTTGRWGDDTNGTVVP